MVEFPSEFLRIEGRKARPGVSLVKELFFTFLFSVVCYTIVGKLSQSFSVSFGEMYFFHLADDFFSK